MKKKSKVVGTKTGRFRSTKPNVVNESKALPVTVMGPKGPIKAALVKKTLPPMPTPHWHVGQLLVCTWYEDAMHHAPARIESDTYVREGDDWGAEQVTITLFPSLGPAIKVALEGFSRVLWHHGNKYELMDPNDFEMASIERRIALESTPKPEVVKPAKVKLTKPLPTTVKPAQQPARNGPGRIQKGVWAPKAGSVLDKVLVALKRGVTHEQLEAIAAVYQSVWYLRNHGIDVVKKKIDGKTIYKVE